MGPISSLLIEGDSPACVNNMFSWCPLMRSEVDNFLKILIKTPNATEFLNQIFKTLRHQEQMILSSNMYEKTYLQVSLKEFLKLFKCLASSGIHTVSGWLDLLFKALHQERKRRKERILTRRAWVPSVCSRSPPIYRHLVWSCFHKNPHNYVYIYQYP